MGNHSIPQRDKQPLALADLLPRLRDPKPDGKGGYWAFCPAHNDGAKRGRRSLHVQEKDGRAVFYCFAGCNYRDIAAALGLARERRRGREPEAVYRYLDEQGELLFEVVRFPGKDFRQRRPDGNGGWVWGLKGVRRVLYRLPEVLAAVREGRTVFVAEGEKDADNLTALGLTATTAPMGAGKWQPEYGEALRGARVVILPDNDEPGRKHAEAVAKALAGVAAEVKAVELPGLPPKGDVSDWLGAGGTKEELLALVEAAEPWQPPAGTGEDAGPSNVLALPVYGPWLEALGGTRYCADRFGNLCYIKYTQDGDREEIPIANFLARPVRELVRDNGADREIEFEIAGILAGGHDLPPARVAAKDFASLSWVPVAWGLAANVEPGTGSKDKVRHAIQSLAHGVKREVIYEHLGWRKIGSEWLYLHAGGALGANGPVEGISVDPGRALRDYALPDPPQGEELAAAVRGSLDLLHVAPEQITYLLLAAVYRAPLAEAGPVGGSIFLAGPTGAKKTELTALAQAHYGAGFHGKNLPGNWDTTANALEKLAFLAKDAVFVVDDFAPKGAAADVQRFHREADRLLRAQGNLAGRGRMRADGSLKTEYYPRGLIISSGEDIPTGQSLRARMLVLEVGPEDVKLDRLTEAQQAAHEGMLAAAMAGYLRWLAPRIEDLKAGLRARQEELRARLRERMRFTHDRTPDTLASLALGWEYFLSFAVEAGAISPEEAKGVWARACQALIAAGEAQAGHLASEEPTSRFLSLLAAAITSGKAHLTDARTDKEPEDPATWGWRENGENWLPLGDKIGWLDGESVLLDPEAAYAAAQKLARDQNSSLPVTQRVLWKRLAERGLIQTEKDVRQTYHALKRMVAGQRRRVLVLPNAYMSLISHNMGNMGNMDNPLGDKGLRAQNPPMFSGSGEKHGHQTWAGAEAPEAECPCSLPMFLGAENKHGQENGPEMPENQGSAHSAHEAHEMGDKTDLENLEKRGHTGHPGTCPACDGRSWWLSRAGKWVCSRCHPCPDPSLAVEVIEA